MRCRLRTALGALATMTFAAPALAAPVARVTVKQAGDFALIGNTVGQDCDPAVPAPIVGTIGACGTNTADDAMDAFWISDSPLPGQALADVSVVTPRRSTAVLSLPPGAQITHAYLYWASSRSTNVADVSCTFERPGSFTMFPGALTSYTVNGPAGIFYYQSVADVTAVVQANGEGPYRTGTFGAHSPVNQNKDGLFTAWWMVVLYTLPGAPLRTLSVLEGLDLVSPGSPSTGQFNGLAVGSAPKGTLGVIGFEGDDTASGDQVTFQGISLSDAQNPQNNFFNSTRSYLGAPVSVAGDLPQLTGTPRSMSGIDLDVVDVSSALSFGQSSATLVASTTGESYFVGGAVAAIDVAKPDLSASAKTVTDLNGGSIVPGDILQYTIDVINTGDDTTTGTVLTDVLPAGVTFVPGSIQVKSGPNAGFKTDVAGDDQADYDLASHTVTVRVGGGANAAVGGSLGPGASSAILFYVTVNPGFTGLVSNQGTLTAGGLSGYPPAQTLTDGDLVTPGAQPTDVNAVCLTDPSCGGPISGVVCDTLNQQCIPGCRGTGNGCPAGQTCTSTDSTIGTCVQNGSSSASSSAGGMGGMGGMGASSSSSSSSSSSTGGMGGMGGASASSGNVGGMGGVGGAGGTSSGNMGGMGGASASSSTGNMGGMGGAAASSSGDAGGGGRGGEMATSSASSSNGSTGGTGGANDAHARGGCLCDLGSSEDGAPGAMLLAACAAMMASARRRQRGGRDRWRFTS